MRECNYTQLPDLTGVTEETIADKLAQAFDGTIKFGGVSDFGWVCQDGKCHFSFDRACHAALMYNLEHTHRFEKGKLCISAGRVNFKQPVFFWTSARNYPAWTEFVAGDESPFKPFLDEFLITPLEYVKKHHIYIFRDMANIPTQALISFCIFSRQPWDTQAVGRDFLLRWDRMKKKYPLRMASFIALNSRSGADWDGGNGHEVIDAGAFEKSFQRFWYQRPYLNREHTFLNNPLFTRCNAATWGTASPALLTGNMVKEDAAIMLDYIQKGAYQ